MELTKQFDEQQYARALESWSWLDLDGKTPRFTSLFGDVFLESVDGAWWFLDTFEVDEIVVFDFAGQLHDRRRDEAPGWTPSRFELAGNGPETAG